MKKSLAVCGLAVALAVFGGCAKVGFSPASAETNTAQTTTTSQVATLPNATTSQNAAQIIPQDYRTDAVFVRLNAFCKGGESEACASLGEYFYARNEFKNALKAFDYACARFSHAQSCMRVGEMLRAGEGVKADAKAAEQVFRFLCFRGESRACNALKSAAR